MDSASPDFARLKSTMKAAWMAGDFGKIANFTARRPRILLYEPKSCPELVFWMLPAALATLQSRLRGQADW
jgi:hypothetical protein